MIILKLLRFIFFSFIHFCLFVAPVASKSVILYHSPFKEAERKRIEAAGQRDSQKIINESLSNQYLQYLYIQNLQNRPGTIYVPYDLPLFKGIQ